MENIFKIAYCHSMAFPNNEANAFDAVWTATALNEICETVFIMKTLQGNQQSVKQYYYIPGSSLKLFPLHFDILPDRLLGKIDNYFPKALAFILHFHPAWFLSKKQKVLYVRDPRLLRYFGLLKKRAHWLDNWVLVYESHDALGMDPNKFDGKNPFEVDVGIDRSHKIGIREAAKQFDVIICNTQALADDLRLWTKNEIDPVVVKLASPLPRLPGVPDITFGSKIILGYIGTIDKLRGVDILIESLRYLPANFFLHVTGKFRHEKGIDPHWLEELVKDPLIKARIQLDNTDHIPDVATEIDQCDILVQTASHDVHDSKYATPQKAFGYMVRGKPILVGDVPGHHELFVEEQNALFYVIDPQKLAERAVYLVEHPGLATKIARGAWEQSVDYTYARRAQDILKLISNVKRIQSDS